MLATKKRRLPLEIIEILIIAFALSWFMKTYLVQFTQIGDSTMLPTLSQNNVTMVDKFFHSKINALERGDLVAYTSSEKESIEIKRVIGLPGDTVEIRNGYTYVNGQPLYEPYAQIPVSYIFEPVVVSDDELFVLNDNRAVINDSRSTGNVSLEKLEGKALFCIWPLTNIKNL